MPQKAMAIVNRNRPLKQSSAADAIPTLSHAPGCTEPTTNSAVAVVDRAQANPTCVQQVRVEDASEEHVMKRTNSENAEWLNKHGSSPQTDLPDAESSCASEGAPSVTVEKDQCHQTHTIDHPQKATLPVVGAHHTEAESTLWLAWYAQTKSAYGCPPQSLHLHDQFVFVDPCGVVPFPRSMADGLGKYFLLGMSTMLQLNQVRYSDMVDVTPLPLSTPHSTPARRYNMLEAMHQCMWLAIVWWQTQAFDVQLNVQLQNAVESTAVDTSACEAMGLGTERDTAAMARMMLHAIPLNVDETLSAASQQQLSQTAVMVDSTYPIISSLMDMRGWSLARVAQSTFCMNPLRDVSFWSTVPMCSVSAFKKTSAQLVLLPSLSSIMRRINMLQTIFYGYSRIMHMLNQWEISIAHFMTMMDQQYDYYPSTAPPPRGDFATLDKNVTQYIYMQLRRLFDETSRDHLPGDARALFLHEPIAFVEQCAFLCYSCSAQAWQVARRNIPDAHAPMALACLMRASMVHWRECYEHLTIKEHSKMKPGTLMPPPEFFGDHCKSWSDISAILPQSRNPITNDATLSDSDLRPSYGSTDNWNASIRKRHRALRVSVIGEKFYTSPTDATHMLANITYRGYLRNVQPTRQAVIPEHDHISLLISSDNRPDLLLHYAASSVYYGSNTATSTAPATVKSDRARWTLIACNELNYPPSVTEVVVPSPHDTTTMSSVSKKIHTASSYLHHLNNARSVVARIFETLPHAYMYRVLEVHGATLDSKAYERATRANVMQHVMRTMNNASGDSDNVGV